MNKLFIQQKQKGFSIMEIIIYLALLIIVSVLIIQSIISLFKNYNIVKTNQDLESTAINILDKINRDVKNTQDISIDKSVFLNPHGTLFLVNSSSSTIKFVLENENLSYYTNDNFVANLSNKNIIVNNFKLYLIQSTTTKAIRVDLGLNAKTSTHDEIVNKNFHTTIQLRK